MRLCFLITTFILLILTPAISIAFCFDEAGQKYGVSPWVLWAIANIESSFDPVAVNRNKNGSVDVGLMQINSCWADQLGSTWNALFDPCTNVMTGAWVLRQCVNQYGNTWQAVGCYHSRTPSRRDAYASKIASLIEKARHQYP